MTTLQISLEDTENYYSTILEKVRFCYNKFPSTIESDERLLQIYQFHFGKIELNRADSIKRAGRSLRHDFTEIFNRSEEKKESDQIHTKAIKQVFAARS